MKFLQQRRTFLIFIAILTIPSLALGYWLISPLFREDEVDEELPAGIVVISPADATATMQAAAAQEIRVDEGMPAEMDQMTSDQITALEIRRGRFRDADSFHQGSGDAIIFRLSTGEHLLRFENFEVTNGPDLHVYLVPRANRGSSVNIEGYIDLGQLKGNVGNQNYTIPAGIEIGEEVSIVIWCEPFEVLFSTASLDIVSR